MNTTFNKTPARGKRSKAAADKTSAGASPKPAGTTKTGKTERAATNAAKPKATPSTKAVAAKKDENGVVVSAGKTLLGLVGLMTGVTKKDAEPVLTDEDDAMATPAKVRATPTKLDKNQSGAPPKSHKRTPARKAKKFHFDTPIIPPTPPTFSRSGRAIKSPDKWTYTKLGGDNKGTVVAPVVAEPKEGWALMMKRAVGLFVKPSVFFSLSALVLAVAIAFVVICDPAAFENVFDHLSSMLAVRLEQFQAHVMFMLPAN